MATIADIELLPNGARFHRVDLHIHSFGGSQDVADGDMTPERIVETAIGEKLDIISITDHNEIKNVEATLNAANGNSLVVIPGVELSTPEGHLLCYLRTLENLEKFFGRIAVADRGKPISRCQNSILECLNLLASLEGYGVLAHVDTAKGYETETLGFSQHKLDVLCHKSLLGIEVKDTMSSVSYSDSDPDINRANCGKERIQRLGKGSRQFLARLLNSDSHSLVTIGKNEKGDHKVTRVKMDNPSFDALRIALEDSDARVRIEDEIPAIVPHVIGIAITGGFLADEKVKFSPNLNCIIGGRGTGKSTLFEAIRCLTGVRGPSSVVDSEIWPSEVKLFWKDQAGQTHALSRPIGGALSNLDDPINGPISFAMDSYSQGETAHISKEANDNPLALLSYLDRFVDIAETLKEENEARDELLKLQIEIEKAIKNVDQIPLYERTLSTTQQQLKALEKAKAKEVIDLQRRLETEREVRSRIEAKVSEIEQRLASLSPKTAVDELATLADPKNLVVGAEAFAIIIASARIFQAEAVGVQSQAKISFQKLRATTNTQLTAWKAKESEVRKVIDEKRKSLEAQKIRLDMDYIQKLARDEARLLSDLTKLRSWKPYMMELRQNRVKASKKRWVARSRIAAIRQAYASGASETLKQALTDLVVSLKFAESAYSPDAEEQIKEAMNWRTIQVPRASLLIERLSMPKLLSAIDNKDIDEIMSVKMYDGTKVFSKLEAERVISRLSEPSIRFALERCEVYDLPRIIVTKAITWADGKPRYVSRDFGKLSLGQQQSVLLALMLSSKSNVPLIIDQPEDNLDGEFIYRSIVPVIRMRKERRQIIVVTHNSNIAVLGDAEQIIVLKSTSDRGGIVSRGSIDDSSTREATCNILEGAKEAFQRRARTYGLNT